MDAGATERQRRRVQACGRGCCEVVEEHLCGGEAGAGSELRVQVGGSDKDARDELQLQLGYDVRPGRCDLGERDDIDRAGRHPRTLPSGLLRPAQPIAPRLQTSTSRCTPP